MRVSRLLATVVLALAASGARAEFDDAAAVELELQMRKGDAARVVALLGEDDLAANLAGEPAVLLGVCTTAAKHAGTMAAKDAEQTARVARVLIAAAAFAAATRPDDSDAHWALAKAYVTRGVARRFGDTGAPAEDWLAAVAALRPAYRTSGDRPEALTTALTYLERGGFTSRAERVAALGHIRWICDAIVADQIKPKAMTLTASSLALGFAQTAISQKQRDAKGFLQAAFDCLRPFVERSDPDVDAATLHEQAVTFRYDHKLVLREKYVTRTDDALAGHLSFEIPISTRWKTMPRAGELSKRVVRLDAEGKEIRRIRFREYSSDQVYVFRDGAEVGGGNLKGLTRLASENAGRLFGRVDSTSKPKKGKLNAEHVGYTTEIKGLDGNGKPQVVRLYTFRGKKLLTYVLVLIDRAPEIPLDRSLRTFLAGVREK